MTAIDLGRLFQTSYVTRAIDAGIEYLSGVLGAQQLTRFDDFTSLTGRSSSILNLAHFKLGGTEIELIEPRDAWPDSIYLDALPSGDQPVAFHHLGFLHARRETWRAAVDRAAEIGIAIPARADTAGACFAYLDTRPWSGHFTELVYRPAGIGPGGVRIDDPRAHDSPPR